MIAGFPFKALGEGVALVHADGVVQPLNQPMRCWLQASLPAGAPVLLQSIVPDPEQRERLQRGEAVLVPGGADPEELLLQVAGDRTWLLVRPCETANDVRLANARMRAMARLAGSLTHELANLFGAAIGVAETLRDHVVAEHDRRTLAELVAGVRRGSELASALERQLRTPRRARPAASVDVAFDELVSLFGKTSQQRAFELNCTRDDHLPMVRIDRVVLVQLLLHTLFLGIQARAGSASLQAHAAAVRIAGGRPRDGVRICCELRGGDMQAMQAAAAAFGDGAGWLRTSLDAPETVRDLLSARLAVHRAGGALRLRLQGASLHLEVDLPAAAQHPQRG